MSKKAKTKSLGDSSSLRDPKTPVGNPALTPKLRFPEFRKAGRWGLSTLGAESRILKGKGIAKADVDPGGSQQCIRYGELYTHYSEVIKVVRSRTAMPASDLFLSRAGDVIIPSSASPPASPPSTT